MTSKDLKQWQIERVLRVVRWCLGYLSRLRSRMDRTFEPNDKLFKLVKSAQDAVFSRSIELHDLECDAMKKETEAKGEDDWQRRLKRETAGRTVKLHRFAGSRREQSMLEGGCSRHEWTRNPIRPNT